MKLILTCAVLLIVASLMLLSINFFGLFKSIRPSNLTSMDLRFKNDYPIDYQVALNKLMRQTSQSHDEYLTQVTNVVAEAVAHVNWNEETDPSKYNQLVPIWENYILYFMGKFSGIPEYQKYHFINYQRSLKRGIGICGDASMITSQVLSKSNIDNQIVSFKTHVVIATKTEDGKEITLDPDYGVVIPFSVDKIADDPAIVSPYYSEAGYSDREAVGVQEVYFSRFQRWDGVKHFVTKKYYFEHLSYILKWALPLTGLLMGWIVIRFALKTN